MMTKEDKQKARNRYIYNFASGLLYPGTLGACLAWVFQSLPTLIWTTEGLLVIAFAIWFFAAYSGWFVRLIEQNRENNGECYGFGRLLGDIVDVVIMIGAFYALGFFAVPNTEPQYYLVFIATFAVPVSAIIILLVQGQGDTVWKRKYPLIFAILVSGVGIIWNCSSETDSLMNAIAWILLSICLYRYLVSALNS